jgi:hypothetical protein
MSSKLAGGFFKLIFVAAGPNLCLSAAAASSSSEEGAAAACLLLTSFSSVFTFPTSWCLDLLEAPTGVSSKLNCIIFGEHLRGGGGGGGGEGPGAAPAAIISAFEQDGSPDDPGIQIIPCAVSFATLSKLRIKTCKLTP